MSCGTTARNCAGRLRPQFHRRPSAALSGRAPESATAAGDAYLRIVAHMHPFERAPHPAISGVIPLGCGRARCVLRVAGSVPKGQRFGLERRLLVVQGSKRAQHAPSLSLGAECDSGGGRQER
jgi:hypothetical protein